MTLQSRLGVAGGCTLVGILLAWAVYQPTEVNPSAARPAPIAGLERRPPSSAAVLWVVAVGVSDYRQEELNLQYADSDARAIATALERQGGGPLYRAVNTLVLTNDEVTRESILDGLTRFLKQAAANDVAVIFLAGHGVQDRVSGSYYFLPFPATADNLLTAGLRMSDLDEMLRLVRQSVRGTVLMLDTCHAGALQLGSGRLAADEAASRLSVGENAFLLAATRPGEQSQETPQLAHGAFTYALLAGLDGGADLDRDGWISVAEWFGYVAREVPRVTGGVQHPYHRMEGTDLIVATADPQGRAVPPAPTWAAIAQAVPTSASTPVPNTIGVMQFDNVRADPQNAWIGTALRVAFNTELSKVRALHVYAPELIDRTAHATGLDQLATAQELGIDRLITGSFSVVGGSIRIDARIVDTSTGLQEGSDSVQGQLNEFLDLQKKLVLSMLRRLRVKVSRAEGKSIRTETNTDVDAYRLLLETEEVVEGTPGATPTPPTPRSDLGLRPLAALLWPSAYAAEPEPEADRAARELLEEYRKALEQKNLDRLAELYVTFPDNRRDVLRAYFDTAIDLQVEIADIAVTPHGSEVAVSYTRRDHFTDKATGKDVRLEVRLTRLVVREGGRWKIAGRP